MIVVRVELHSAVTGEVETLGALRIANDGTGTRNLGNYDVERVNRSGRRRRGRVERHRRMQVSVWRLVQDAIEATFGNRSDESGGD